MRNIILTGFMGTGKTSVGLLVAQQLNRPFIDMDQVIEERSQKSVEEIFAEYGEETFRRMEAELCRELGQQEDLVVATGGGTLLPGENREALERTGIIVCLNCELDEALKRVNQDIANVRPLLSGEEQRSRAEVILASRQETYALLPWQIDTTRRSVAEIAAEISEIGHIQVLTVHHPTGEYPIWLGLHAMDHLGQILRTSGIPQGTRLAVVSNPVVAPLYAETVQQSLIDNGYHPFLTLIPDGEADKTPASVQRLYVDFLAGGLDRRDTVLALGGGVTGDVAGFAAATYMRGVRFVQVPTTLLSMVDSSIGGKTGVDLPEGKNLIGAFLQPTAVIMDPLTLQSLPQRELRSGMAEVIKHAVLADADFIATLEQEGGNFSLWWSAEGPAWLRRTLRVKMDIVQRDPYEKGVRALLNLGHTLGHAVELVSDFRINHGEAVSLGMVLEADLACSQGLAPADLLPRLRNLLQAWGLPVQMDAYPLPALLRAVSHDKKKDGRRVRFALPRRLGEADLFSEIPDEVIKEVLLRAGAREK